MRLQLLQRYHLPATDQRPAPPRQSRPSAAALLLCLALPWSSLASNSGALREYKAGNFDKAQQEFERLLQKNQDDLDTNSTPGLPPISNQQYNQAADHFSKALNSTDIKLQEKAYYNRGNTLFHLGENMPEPQKKIETWEKSLKDFEATTKLNPQEADAKHNAELVKRLLEELKQHSSNNSSRTRTKTTKQQKQDQQQDQQPKNDQQKQQEQKQDQQQQQNQDQQKQDQQHSNRTRSNSRKIPSSPAKRTNRTSRNRTKSRSNPPANRRTKSNSSSNRSRPTRPVK